MRDKTEMKHNTFYLLMRCPSIVQDFTAAAAATAAATAATTTTG